MQHRFRAALTALVLVPVFSVSAQQVPTNLGFEARDTLGRPTGWGISGSGFQLDADSTVPFAGKYSLRSRWADSEQWTSGRGHLGVVTGTFPLGLARGRTLRLTGYIRTERLTKGYAGLWLRVDAGPRMIAFDFSERHGARQTTPWTRYAIDLPVDSGATAVEFGVLHSGNGTAWFDSLTIEARGPALARTVADAEELHNLGFEVPDSVGRPAGWFVGAGSGFQLRLDSVAPFVGRVSLQSRWVDSTPWSPGGGRVAGGSAPISFQLIQAARGRALHLAGYIRTEGMTAGGAGLILSINAGSRTIAVDSMERRGPRQTTPWTRFDIELPVDSAATGGRLGVYHRGNGTTWFDSLTIEVTKPALPRVVAVHAPTNLGFEARNSSGELAGWDLNGSAYQLVADSLGPYGGKFSLRSRWIDSLPWSDGRRSSGRAARDYPISLARGRTLHLSGYIRTESVTAGYAGLRLYVFRDNDTVVFDNMATRGARQTTPWTRYDIELPVDSGATDVMFGVIHNGNGTAWFDSLTIEVVGPVMPRRVAKYGIDVDREFDLGSGVSIRALTPIQIRNLVTLGKVWGFLKYHHPQVTTGMRHWDYDLFRVLPKVLAAPDRIVANKVLFNWITELGPVAPCAPCATLDESTLHLRPDIAWLSDQAMLGVDLSSALRAIYVNRLPGRQFYLSRDSGPGNPDFLHELDYGFYTSTGSNSSPLPDAGFQLLALYRFWNIIEYWSPYRDVVGEDWNQVLAEFIPRVALATTRGDYFREMMAAIAMDHDTHAKLYGGLSEQPPKGSCQLPVTMRFIEDRAVVTSYLTVAGQASGLKPGDVITRLDGVPVEKLVENWAPYYAASNDPTRLRDIAVSMTRGPCGEAAVVVRRGTEALELRPKRLPTAGLGRISYTHDLAGETFRRLSSDIAYLKLSSVKASEAAHYIESAAGTKGLIIDIRNYPSEPVVDELGALLVDRPTRFGSWTYAGMSNPGAFKWGAGELITPAQPHYAGRVVILVDEETQSQAEFTTMAFRSAPNAIVIGSTTAGADGDVSRYDLPGGVSTMITGLGVFYPDKRPTQRIGITPDVVVKPTIVGIRDGRDELMEAAIRQILGANTSQGAIDKLIGRKSGGMQ